MGLNRKNFTAHFSRFVFIVFYKGISGFWSLLFSFKKVNSFLKQEIPPAFHNGGGTGEHQTNRKTTKHEVLS